MGFIGVLSYLKGVVPALGLTMDGGFGCLLLLATRTAPGLGAVYVLDHVAAESGALGRGNGKRSKLARLLESGGVAHLVTVPDLEASQHHCLRTAYIFITPHSRKLHDSLQNE